VLAVLYALEVPHGRQAASPASEKVCAGQLPQTVLAAALQAEVGAEPAEHARHAAQGARPDADQLMPLTQGVCRHWFVALPQA